MRTNVFSKTSGKQAGGTGHGSTASEFASTLGYPTEAAPVQLKLQPGDFKFLDIPALDLTDMAAFHQQVSQLNEDAVHAALNRFESLSRPEQRRPEMSLAKKLLNTQAAHLALATILPAEQKDIASLLPGDAKAPQVTNYVPAPPSGSASTTDTPANSPVVDEETAEYMHYDGIERQQSAYLEAVAKPYLDKVYLGWKPTDALPSAAVLRRLRTLLNVINDYGYASRQPLLQHVVSDSPRPENLSDMAWALIQASEDGTALGDPIRNFFKDKVAALNPQGLKRLFAAVTNGIDPAKLSRFLAGFATISEQAKALKTRFPLHLFLFPGHSSSAIQKQVAAAQKFYAPYGIDIQVADKTVVTVEQAQACKLPNTALIYGYTAGFNYGKGSNATKQEVVQQHFPAKADTQAIYVFGDFVPLGANKNTIGVTWSPDEKVRGPKDSIFIADGGGYPLTLAHELGHMMGGHIGGAHTLDPFNLMYESTNDNNKQLAILQLVFMKGGPRMKLADEKQ